MSEFFGKYRAKVVDVDDPENRGRIRVICPKVLGESRSPWCEPCLPLARSDGRGDFCIPSVDDFVWIEFEEGNPSKPIYTGGLWGKEGIPSYLSSKDRLISHNSAKIILKEDGSVLISSPGYVNLRGNAGSGISSMSFTAKIDRTIRLTGDEAIYLNGYTIGLRAGSSLKLQSKEVLLGNSNAIKISQEGNSTRIDLNGDVYINGVLASQAKEGGA